MKLTRKEKTTVLVGSVIVGLTILIAFVIAPLARAWSFQGGRLAPRLRQVEELERRADRQDLRCEPRL